MATKDWVQLRVAAARLARQADSLADALKRTEKAYGAAQTGTQA